MTDSDQTEQPNILLNATALQNYTANFAGTTSPMVNVHVGPALDSFSALQNQTGPLETSAAVIFTKYFCQVPMRKPTG